MALPVRPPAGPADCSSTSLDSVTSPDPTTTLSNTCTFSQTSPSRSARVSSRTFNNLPSASTPETSKHSVAPALHVNTAANTAVSLSTAKVDQVSLANTIGSSAPATSTTITMCAPLIGSSPLSSPISPLSGPPGAWINDPSPVNEAGLRSPSVAESKHSAMPLSSGSSKSAVSNSSKKRARIDEDDSTSDKGAKQRKQSPAPIKHASVGLTPSTRPTRNRKAPQLFTPVQPAPKKPAAPRKSATIPRVWQPKVVTESTKSKLLDVDVYHMLLKDEAWTGLSVAQKRELFSLISDTNTNARFLREITAGDNSSATRPFELRINSSEFRCDVATFMNELSMGYMLKSWQEYAHRAVEKRATGIYDDWKDEETEEWWGKNA